MMKKLMKFLLVMMVLGVSSGCYGQELKLNKNIELARESFEDVYYELLKNNYFDAYYNNNLIIDTDVSHDFARNGLIIFKLVEWLQTHDDRDSRFLLKRLNKLFYLELYRFIAKMDPEKIQNGALFDALSKLYHYKVPSAHLGVAPVPPFQTTLTKAVILIFTLNAGPMFFNDKKESLIFALDTIRQEMLDINDRLGDKKIDEKDIRLVFHVLQAYAAQEPIVKPGNIKKIVIGAAVITACVGIVYLVWNRWMVDKTNLKTGKPVFDENGNVIRQPLGAHINERISHKWNALLGRVADDLGLLGEKVGEKIATGAGKAMMKIDKNGKFIGVKPEVTKVATDLGRTIVHGIATKSEEEDDDDEPKEINPKLKAIGKAIVEGATDQVKPMIKKLTKAAKRLGKVAEEDIKPLGEKVINKVDELKPMGEKLLKKMKKMDGDNLKKTYKKAIKIGVNTAQRQAKNNVKGWFRGIPVVRRLVPDDEPEPAEPDDDDDEEEEEEEE